MYRRLLPFAVGIALALPAGGQSENAPSSLRGIMQELEHHMCRASASLLREDYDSLARAAEAIARHPAPSPAEAQRLERILGPEASRFREADEAVHLSALSLREAAERHDLPAAVKQTGELLSACTVCHHIFRERVRRALPARPQPSRELSPRGRAEGAHP
jgi:hypothetical protein